MIDVRFSSDVSARYKAYSLCCQTLLNSYEDLSAACDIDDLIEKFNEKLQRSYCDDYSLMIESVVLMLKRLIISYNENIVVCEKLAAGEEGIVDGAEEWDFESAVEELRGIGRGLAQEFYLEGGGDKNKELIESNDPEVALDNTCLSEPGRCGTSRPITYWLGEIHVPFHEGFEFCHYLSYPFLFFHEYASHVYVPRIDSRTFEDGWMMYAIELFMKTRWRDLCQKYPLISAQRNVLRETWLPDPDFGRLAKIGYKLAEDVDVWVDKFLEFTWDLASYPADFAGQLSFHDEFIEVIKKYVTRARGPVLHSIAAHSGSAGQLYANLREDLES